MRYTRRYVKVPNAQPTCTSSQEQLLKHIDSRNFVKIDANLLQLAVKFDAGKRRKKAQSKTPNSRRVQQKMGIMNMRTPMRRKSTSSLKSPTTTSKRNSAVHVIVNGGFGGLQGLQSFERKSLATNLKNANMKKVSIQLINAHRSSSTSTSTSSTGFGVTEHQDLRKENQDQVDEVSQSVSTEEESQPLTYTFGRYKSSTANTATMNSTALVNPHSLTMNINTADADDAAPYQPEAVIEYFDATFKAWAG